MEFPSLDQIRSKLQDVLRENPEEVFNFASATACPLGRLSGLEIFGWGGPVGSAARGESEVYEYAVPVENDPLGYCRDYYEVPEWAHEFLVTIGKGCAEQHSDLVYGRRCLEVLNDIARRRHSV